MALENLKLALTVREAAAATSIGRNTLYAAISAGSLKALHVGRRVIIPRALLEEWLLHQAGDTDARLGG